MNVSMMASRARREMRGGHPRISYDQIVIEEVDDGAAVISDGRVVCVMTGEDPLRVIWPNPARLGKITFGADRRGALVSYVLGYWEGKTDSIDQPLMFSVG